MGGSQREIEEQVRERKTEREREKKNRRDNRLIFVSQHPGSELGDERYHAILGCWDKIKGKVWRHLKGENVHGRVRGCHIPLTSHSTSIPPSLPSIPTVSLSLPFLHSLWHFFFFFSLHSFCILFSTFYTIYLSFFPSTFSLFLPASYTLIKWCPPAVFSLVMLIQGLWDTVSTLLIHLLYGVNSVAAGSSLTSSQ